MVLLRTVEIDQPVCVGSRVNDIIFDRRFIGFVDFDLGKRGAGFCIIILIVQIIAAQLYHNGIRSVQALYPFSVFLTAVDTGGTAHITKSFAA